MEISLNYMKFCIERSLDYYRFQNLFILNLIILSINIGVFFFENFSLIITVFLSFLKIIFVAVLFSKKCIEIKNNKIHLFYSAFGIKFKETKKLEYNSSSEVSFKKFKSSNLYQKGIRYERSFHVDEDFYEIYIDLKYLTTLNSEKAYSKFINSSPKPHQ